ncbi:MAG: GNAT family N-acetyltransferase [Geminicoccaceae bacterium]
MIDVERVTIRDADREDLPAIIALLEADPLGRLRDGLEDNLGAYEQAFEAIQASPTNRQIVAELDRQIVGTFQLTFIPGLSFRGGERVQIESVRVAENLRGQGLGRHLMLWVLDLARARGARLVQLTTNRTRADAHRFYEALGFEATHSGMKIDLGAKGDG